MRVLHVIPSLSSRRGGPSAAIIPMVAALRARGVDAEIASTDEDFEHHLGGSTKPIVHQGVPIRLFSRALPRIRALREFAYSAPFANWLRNHLRDFDLIHTHALFSHLSTTAMRLARKNHIPYVTRPLGQLGVWPLRQSRWRKKIYLAAVERNNLLGAGALHFTSASERSEAAPAGFPSCGVVIPHGIELPDIMPDARARLRLDLGLSIDTRIVLFLGRIHAKKGIDLLVSALSKVENTRSVLLLAGEGPEREELERLIFRLGLASRVRWLGHVDGERKQLCLQGADLFALTSHHENLGVAVLESLAAGTPVLLSEHVALAPDVAQHRLGTVVPLHIETIRHALSEILASPQDDDGNRRRKFVHARFSWHANAAALETLYEKLRQKIALAEP